MKHGRHRAGLTFLCLYGKLQMISPLEQLSQISQIKRIFTSGLWIFGWSFNEVAKMPKEVILCQTQQNSFPEKTLARFENNWVQILWVALNLNEEICYNP